MATAWQGGYVGVHGTLCLAPEVASGSAGLGAILVSRQIIRPDELELIRELESGGLSAVACRLGMTRQGAQARVARLARRLDAGGYDGSILRLLARRRRPRTQQLTGLQGTERTQASEWVEQHELISPHLSRARHRASWLARARIAGDD